MIDISRGGLGESYSQCLMADFISFKGLDFGPESHKFIRNVIR